MGAIDKHLSVSEESLTRILNENEKWRRDEDVREMDAERKVRAARVLP